MNVFCSSSPLAASYGKHGKLGTSLQLSTEISSMNSSKSAFFFFLPPFLNKTGTAHWTDSAYLGLKKLIVSFELKRDNWKYLSNQMHFLNQASLIWYMQDLMPLRKCKATLELLQDSSPPSIFCNELATLCSCRLSQSRKGACSDIAKKAVSWRCGRKWADGQGMWRYDKIQIHDFTDVLLVRCHRGTDIPICFGCGSRAGRFTTPGVVESRITQGLLRSFNLQHQQPCVQKGAFQIIFAAFSWSPSKQLISNKKG